MGIFDNIKNFLGRVLCGVDLKQREQQIKDLKKKVEFLDDENKALKVLVKEELKLEGDELNEILEEIKTRKNNKFSLIIDFQIKSLKPNGSTASMSLHIDGIAGAGYSPEEVMGFYNNKLVLREMLVKAIETDFAPQQIIGVNTKMGADFVRTQESPTINVDCVLSIEDGRGVPFKFVNYAYSNNEE